MTRHVAWYRGRASLQSGALAFFSAPCIAWREARRGSARGEHDRLLLDFEACENHVARGIAVLGLQRIRNAVAARDRANSEFQMLSVDEVIDAASRNLAYSKDGMRRHEPRHNFASLKQLVILDALRSCKQCDAVFRDQ